MVRRAVAAIPNGVPITCDTDRSQEHRRRSDIFEVAERRALSEISSDCRQVLESGMMLIPLVVDPVLFPRSESEGIEKQQQRFFAVVNRAIQDREIVVPYETCLDFLERRGFTSRAFFDEQDLDRGRVLIGFFERVLANSSCEEGQDLLIRPRRAGNDKSAEKELSRMIGSLINRGHRTLRILTEQRAWEESLSESDVAEVEMSSAECARMILEPLEVVS